MQSHELQSNRKPKKRIGRGGKRGTYCGKGQKGQNSRAGAKSEPIIRQFVKKYPKLRGYRTNHELSHRVVNLGDIENNFEVKEIVSPKTLHAKGLVTKIDARIPVVKILAKGDIKKAIRISGCKISKSAKEKLEAVGGKLIQ